MSDPKKKVRSTSDTAKKSRWNRLKHYFRWSPIRKLIGSRNEAGKKPIDQRFPNGLDLPHTTAENIVPLMVRVGVSRFLEGQIGLFATRYIKEGEVIGGDPIDSIKELICPWPEYEKLDSGFKAWVDDNCLGTPEGFVIIGNPNFWPCVWNMNHSCDGNAGFDGDYNFVAIRDIEAGEEVTYDYGLGETNPKFRMECRCRSSNCRGTITGNDWEELRLNPEKKRYMLPNLR